MRRVFASILLCLVCATAFGDFKPTKTPELDGTRATVDLPANMQMKNVGGIDGLGLCVFTSLQHAAFWQNIIDLDGYREWMRRQRGGGWPGKVDATLKQYCQSKGVPVPEYVQHTGGDISFLELALRTGRCPCVTYAGNDDFYRGGIDHMVNLAFLDGSKAAIIDNNRPGTWLWMTRQEFQSRWLARGGGWAVVFLAPPPTPYNGTPQHEFHARACGCDPGMCDQMCEACQCGVKKFEQCEGGKCVRPLVPTSFAPPAGATKLTDDWYQDETYVYLLGKGVYNPNTGLWAALVNGQYASWGQPPKDIELPILGGVDKKELNNATQHEYTKNGVFCSKEDAHASLIDDTNRWHLAVVGSDEFRKRVQSDLSALPSELKDKIHVQTYKPEAWQVAQLKLIEGVTLRKPAIGRVSGDVGMVGTAEYNVEALRDLFKRPLGPTPAPAPAKPDPKNPNPTPATPINWQNWLMGIGAAIVLLLVARKK